MSNNEAVLFTQKDAEQLARLFSVVFNSAMLYGGAHQTTVKSIGPFFEFLSKSLVRAGMISLVLDRESLFFDEWQLDKVINARRILVQFTKLGLNSVTFEKGVTVQELEIFFKYAGDSNVVTPVDTILQKLHGAGSAAIKINYIRYGRITNDQTVIGKNEQPAGAQPATQTSTGLSAESLGKLEEIISLAKLFENPGRSVTAFTKSALDPKNTDNAVQSISNLRATISGNDAISMDLLLNAVYELKMDLTDAIAIQKETGKLFAKTEPLSTEVDKLTCDVIVKLVREEFGSGDISVRRLAQIILRMLPDTNELKRLLPELKPALLSAGMTLSNYLELIKSLNVEFESESLAGTLSQAALGIGASVNELVHAIQAQPDEAARLLVMASEIGKSMQDNEGQLSTMLTEYIEKVSTSLALQSKDLSTDDGKSTLQQLLQQLEHGLLDELKKYGVEDHVLSNVAKLLTERRDETYDYATQQWIANELGSKQNASPQEISDQLMRMVNGQAQLERLHKPLTTALAAQGYDSEQMEAVLNRLATRIATGKMAKLPPGALAPNNMTFLLDREIKCRARYHTTFSTLLITPEALLHNETARNLTDDEVVAIRTRMFSIVKHEVRDIDLVGNLGGSFERSVFIIMTMTGEAGAKNALERIENKIGRFQIPLKNGTATVVSAASVTVPVQDEKYELKSYVDFCAKNHELAVKACRSKYHRPE